MSHTLSVACIQNAYSSSQGKNRESNITAIENAAKNDAQLILLPELHESLYFCQSHSNQHFDLAEPVPGPSTQVYSDLARTLGVVLVLSLFEARGPGLYHNTAVVIESDGSIAGRYRKMHIPEDPGFHEKFYFSPGDLGFTPIDTSLGRLGVLICWDQWFPEAARAMTLAGADILLYPTAIGWAPDDHDTEKERQFEAWQLAQRGHAVCNQLPVVVANRFGHEELGGGPGINFWGGSFIAGQQGEMLVEAGHDRSEVIAAEIDLNKTKNERHVWPFLRDRRVDAYQSLLKKWAD